MKKNEENWYVLQVFSGKEKKIKEKLKRINLINVEPYLPLKKLKIKKKGILKNKIIPLYPGYIFILGQPDIQEFKKMLTFSDIIKIVGGIKNPGILQKSEIEIVRKITPDGIANYSKVVKVGTKIKVISGPLKELEGNIVSVDRRKQRVIVKLPLLNSFVKVSLGFEYIKEKDLSGTQ